MRSPVPLCVCALALASPLLAQSGPVDELWFARTTSPERIDRFGTSRSVASLQPRLLRRTLAGDVYGIGDGSGIGSLVVYDRAGSIRGVHTLGAVPRDVVSDAQSDAWISLDSAQIEHRNRFGALVGSIALAGVGRALALDETGRLWIGVENQPTALLSWRTLAGGSLFTVGLPGSFGQVVDLVVDGRSGGSHAFVIGDAGRTILDIDRQGAVVQTISIPPVVIAGSPGALTQLALAPDGRLCVAAADGLWIVDPATASSRQVWFRQVSTLGFDAKGALWFVSGTELVDFDLATERRQYGMQSFADGTCDDPAGLTLAQIVDRAGDTDADGVANGVEVGAGTNPFDPLSTPALAFGPALLETAPGDDLELVTHGALGWGFVLVGAPPIAPPVTIPGVDGALRIGTLFPVDPPAMPVPGRLRLRVPTGMALGPIAMQVFRLPVGAGAPRLSEYAVARFAATSHSTLIETFDRVGQFDEERSSGFWAQGIARPGAVGGVGRLGSFVHTDGVEVQPGVFEFRTDGQDFPAAHTLFGRVERVTDGVFDFTDFAVPAGITVRFVGSKPAVVRVRGSARVFGTIDVSGADVGSNFNARSPVQPPGSAPVGVAGQPGGRGGCGAGDGGAGAEGCDGLGAEARFDGMPGADLVAPAGSAYAALVAGTGGVGGGQFPASGFSSNVTFNLFFAISGQVAAGGGGGGYHVPGGVGHVVSVFTSAPADRGPDVLGGLAIPFVPQPVGISALDHFLLAGTGGGGGGSHPVNMTTVEIAGSAAAAPRAWHAGAGGAGGGGAVALRVGRDLEIGAQGVIAARGGRAGEFLVQQVGPPAPGGGGSGGSVLMQVGRAVYQHGRVELSGGAGGRLRHSQFNGLFVESRGGDGSPGFVRLERVGGASLAELGTVDGPSLGAENVGALQDRDVLNGQVTRFYVTGGHAPRWLHYTLRVLANGMSVDFSDDPAAFNPAVGPTVPVQLFVQAAQVDAGGRPIGQIGPWRTTVADLDQDGGNGIRFMLVFNSAVANDVGVDELSVAFR